jgi:hypothetical protein
VYELATPVSWIDGTARLFFTLSPMKADATPFAASVSASLPGLVPGRHSTREGLRANVLLRQLPVVVIGIDPEVTLEIREIRPSRTAFHEVHGTLLVVGPYAYEDPTREYSTYELRAEF